LEAVDEDEKNSQVGWRPRRDLTRVIGVKGGRWLNSQVIEKQRFPRKSLFFFLCASIKNRHVSHVCHVGRMKL